MALAVLDGNQSATTLSSVVTGGEHIVAHSVVSLGSNAISNITTAVSGSIVTIPNLNILPRSVATEGVTDGTLNFIKIGGHQSGANQTAHIVHVSAGGSMSVDATDSVVSISNFPATQPVSLTSVPTHGVTLASTTVTVSSLPAISGTVTVGNTVTIAGTVTANPTGTQTIAGSVTLGAGTAQIGSVTASISGTVPVSGTFWQATQPVSLASVPAHAVTLTSTTVTVSSMPAISGSVSIGAGVAQIGSVTASISGTVPVSISSVTIGNSITIGSCVTHGVTLTSTTVTVSALPRPTWTNYSGTVTTANTAVTAISTTTRSYLLAQVTTGQMFLNIGATATSLNSVYFSAGQGFAWETSVPQGIVSIISAVTGTNYVLKEG